MSPRVRELRINGLMAGTAVRQAKKTSVGVAYYAAAGGVALLAVVFFAIAGYGLLLETHSMPIAAGTRTSRRTPSRSSRVRFPRIAVTIHFVLFATTPARSGGRKARNCRHSWAAWRAWSVMGSAGITNAFPIRGATSSSFPKSPSGCTTGSSPSIISETARGSSRRESPPVLRTRRCSGCVRPDAGKW